VKAASLVKYRQEKGKNLQLSGISGNQIEIRGKVQLEIKNSLEPKSQMCYVVDSLPRNLDIILGQD
jgi:hypothetical protein